MAKNRDLAFVEEYLEKERNKGLVGINLIVNTDRKLKSSDVVSSLASMIDAEQQGKSFKIDWNELN